jgi:hypothetical protein
MPSQSAQGKIPRQLCCIGFSSSIGWLYRVDSERWLQPIAQRANTPLKENTIFFTVFPYNPFHPFATPSLDELSHAAL